MTSYISSANFPDLLLKMNIPTANIARIIAMVKILLLNPGTWPYIRTPLESDIILAMGFSINKCLNFPGIIFAG